MDDGSVLFTDFQLALIFYDPTSNNLKGHLFIYFILFKQYMYFKEHSIFSYISWSTMCFSKTLEGIVCLLSSLFHLFFITARTIVLGKDTKNLI